MDAHAHAQRHTAGPVVGGERTLCCGGRCDGILRTLKRDEERVSLRVDLLAFVLLVGGSEEAVVVGAGTAIALTKLLQESRRSLDVGEEECDRPARELRHSA